MIAEVKEPTYRVARLFKRRLVEAINKSFVEDKINRHISLYDIREIVFLGSTIDVRMNDGTLITLHYNEI